MNKLPFIKMHGLGNDFVVIDTRAAPLALGPAQARRIAERRRGVGCDQVIVIAESEMGLADAAMRIFNADGGEVGACGNAARCVARLLMAETGRDHATIETEGGIVDAAAGPDGAITVDLGVARTGWRDIPLAEERDTLHLGIAAGPLRDPVAVSMGNPHAVFFVADAASVDLAALGPKLERHPIFPERANIEVAQVLAPTRLRLRVWERGTGITPACGTGACATLVAAMRRGLAERRAEIVLDGGSLHVEWLENGHVLLTGPAETSFSGHLDGALLAVEEAAP